MKKRVIGLMIIVIFVFTFNVLGNEQVDFSSRLDVRMGELTGAGSRFSINTLAGFVHPKGIIMKEDCTNIILKDIANPKISDVIQVQIDQTVIPAREMTGFILKN